MSVILNALPYLNREYRLQASNRGADSYLIHQNQIVCWASLTLEGVAWARHDNLSMFPVLIDTGNGRNFNIREDHLVTWARATNLVELFGNNVIVNGQKVSLRKATLWLYRNIPGELAADINVEPFPIDFSSGIEVFNDPVKTSFPRLPLWGMRALHVSHLELTINASERRIFLRQLSS